MRREPKNIEHGYNRYTYGCRCQVCTAAKAQRSRKYRQEAYQKRDLFHAANDGNYVADGIFHGYNGYQNHACRCEVCITAWRQRQRDQYAARKARAKQ